MGAFAILTRVPVDHREHVKVLEEGSSLKQVRSLGEMPGEHMLGLVCPAHPFKLYWRRFQAPVLRKPLHNA